jgi:hypothetical protein
MAFYLSFLADVDEGRDPIFYAVGKFVRHYIDPDRVVNKEFFLELYRVEEGGSRTASPLVSAEI